MPSALTEPAPPAAAPTLVWDTEVFVLRGEDRSDLRGRVLALAGLAERQPGATLSEVAASLAAELRPGGARLAAVSGAADDLAKKLRRAADRLADPKCRQIRDAAGVYFFEQGLY